MAGVSITLEPSKENAIGRVLLEIPEQIKDDLQPMLKVIGETIRASIARNFEKGGRPDAWKDVSEATRERKKSTHILIEEGYAGGLLGSIHAEIAKDYVKVGTDKDYAAAHHFGVDKQITQQIGQHIRRITQAFGKPLGKTKEVTVKAHSRSFHMRLDARPFMLIQNEDVEDIEEMITAKIKGLLN